MKNNNTDQQLVLGLQEALKWMLPCIGSRSHNHGQAPMPGDLKIECERFIREGHLPTEEVLELIQKYFPVVSVSLPEFARKSGFENPWYLDAVNTFWEQHHGLGPACSATEGTLVERIDEFAGKMQITSKHAAGRVITVLNHFKLPFKMELGVRLWTHWQVVTRQIPA